MIWFALAGLLVACVALVATRSMELVGYVALGGIATLAGLLIPFSGCEGRGCYPAVSNLLAWPFVMVAFFLASLALRRRLMRSGASWPASVAVCGVWPLATLTVCSELIREDGFGSLPLLWAAMAPLFAVLVLQGWRMGTGEARLSPP